MARNAKLNPQIKVLRTALQDDNKLIVEEALQEWSNIASHDFEVFLDILEGVVNKPLKRIYKAKLQNNDDWWHCNFAHKPSEFFNLFSPDFEHCFTILSWLLNQLEMYNAVDATFITEGSGLLLKMQTSLVSTLSESTPLKELKEGEYFLYAEEFGLKPTSAESLTIMMNREDLKTLNKKILTGVQLLGVDGQALSPRLSTLKEHELTGSFDTYCPWEWEWSTVNHFRMGKEYLRMQGDFVIFERDTGYELMISGGGERSGRKPYTPRPAMKYAETVGRYLLLTNDTSVNLKAEEICKNNRIGLKLEGISYVTPTVGIRISFQDGATTYTDRWLFVHDDGPKKSLQVLKNTTWLDDWMHLKTVLPSLDENTRHRLIDTVYDKLSEVEQACALDLM